MCDQDNPQKISFEDVSAAAFRIQSGIVKTPCVVSCSFFFKNESRPSVDSPEDSGSIILKIKFIMFTHLLSY